jgi:hypothetical protein
MLISLLSLDFPHERSLKIIPGSERPSIPAKW